MRTAKVNPESGHVTYSAEHKLEGCGDNSCIFREPTEEPTQGTNGGCRCISWSMTTAEIVRLKRNIAILKLRKQNNCKTHVTSGQKKIRKAPPKPPTPPPNPPLPLKGPCGHVIPENSTVCIRCGKDCG